MVVVIMAIFVVVVALFCFNVDENLFDAQTRLADRKMTQKPS